MTALEEYFSFDHKEQTIPKAEKVYAPSQFEELLKKLAEYNDNGKYQWRGMHEAKLQLYNSSQRYYDRIMCNSDIDQYHDFIYSLVSYVRDWNNSTIDNYLGSQEIDNDPVAIMTLMQHYRFPTPLLDFSENPFIALYFSSQDSNYTEHDNDIRNYSSLYAFNTKIENLKDFNKQYAISEMGAYGDKYEPLKTTKLLVISKDTKEFKIGTSLNIINQSGSFIYSNNPTLPLENMLVRMKITSADDYPLKCWHIHKRFNSEIRLFLEREHNITTHFVFPDLYKMIEHFHNGK